MAARTAAHLAYETATARLRKTHPGEFEALLEEERTARGLPPKRSYKTREQKIADLRAELAALERGER